MGDSFQHGRHGLDDGSAIFDWALVGKVAAFVLRSPLRHKALALTSFSTIVILAVVLLRVLPFKYQADAVLLVRPNPLSGALSTGVNRELDMPTRFARETLLKRETLRALVVNTRLVDRSYEKRPALVQLKQEIIRKVTGYAPTEEELIGGFVDTLEDRLMIDVREDTLAIGFQWWDPEIAFEVVQGALDTFLDARRSTEIATIAEAVGILEDHRIKVESDIEERIAKLEKRRADAGTRRPSRPVSMAPAGPDRELGKLETLLATRKQAAATLAAFQQERIAQLQATLAQQESTFAGDHPAIARTRRELESLTKPSPQSIALSTEIELVERQIGQKKASTSGGAQASSTFASQIDQLRDLYGEADPRTSFELRQLELLLDQHWNIMGRINASRLEMETAQASFNQRYSVISPPQVPTRTVKPYRMMIALGGALGGLAFALFASTVFDLRKGLILERWQVEQQLSLPVIVDFRRR